MTAVLTSRLPWSDQYGNTVDIRDGQVLIRLTVTEMPATAALDVAAYIGHAVALTGAQRAATGCACTTHPNHTNPTEGA